MNGHPNGHPNGHREELPRADDAGIELAHPTAEERGKQLECNGVAWRGALTLDGYFQREAHLLSQDLTKDGGLTSWVLVDRKDAKNRRVLCGCESYRKKALVASNGIIRDTIAHGIGSVFCPPDRRGKGYAGRMIRDVGERLKTWQSDESCMFSILFSDIGKTFYAHHGWMPFPSAHVSVPTTLKIQSPDLPFARPLYAVDLPKLCAIDEVLIRRSLQKEASTSDATFVAMIPDSQTIKWHHAREEFVGGELHGKIPQIKGAIVGDTEGQRIWCYWTRMWYNEDPTKREENTLHILRLVIEEKEIVDWERKEFTEADKQRYTPAIAALLKCAVEEADTWNMENVEIWNPNAITIEAAKLIYSDTQVIQRDAESICSLRWYGDDNALDKIVWLGNEKYGWC